MGLREVRFYTYDAENRITSVDGGATASYVYNAEGQRVTRAVVGGLTLDYVYDLAGHAAAGVNAANGIWWVGEVFAGGRHIATYANSTTYFDHGDWLGTERVRTAVNGSVCESITSLPFGDGQSTTGSCADASTRHFTGKERDSESGLDNFGARYNSSSMGRFMSPDPKILSIRHLVNPQKWNKYAYTINNPLRYFDPNGMEEIEVQLRAFIPQKSVTVVGTTNGGDNRTFSTAANASSRTSITVRIETDASIRANPIISVNSVAGQSTKLDASGNCGSVWSQTFTYDAFGNLTKAGTNSFNPGYNTATNRMSTGATYDVTGDVLGDGLHSYAWNSDTRPTTIDTVTVTYDALERMVEQTKSGTSTEIVYDALGNKLALMNGTSTLVKGFAPLPAGATAVYNASGLQYYRHPDWLGSSRFSSTPSRAMYNDLAFAPFGEQYAQSGTTGVTDTSFGGNNGDTTTNLYDAYFREYGIQGRWPSPDPAGIAAANPANPQSWNRYAYALNNPLLFSDPFGLEPAKPCAQGSDPDANGDQCICDDSGCWWVPPVISTVQVNATSDDSVDLLLPTNFGALIGPGPGQPQTPSWWGTFAKSFFTFAGGPGNKPTCAGQALTQIASDLNPFVHQGAEMVGQDASQAQTARALRYAASRPNAAGGIGLICPKCSSVFRGMMSKAKLLGEAADILGLLEVSYAANSARNDVSAEARNGGCAAAFPVF